jgi:transglutaminase-like putative cysteine protease
VWLRTRCELVFQIEYPTPFVLMLRPRSGAQQWIASEEYLLFPSVPVFEFTDDYGNLCQRLIAPPGRFKIYTSAKILIADTVDEEPGGEFVEVQYLPDSVLKYLLPSRYCESDYFHDLAFDISASQKPGYDQVAEIQRWLRDNIQFQPGHSQVPLSAIEVNRKGSGVCRDLTHLGVALCRSLSIPARVVVGYLHGLEPMELHAWFEAFVAGRWYTFDATQSSRKGGYVAIGYGRDAADVAIYNQFGPAVYPAEQCVVVDQIEG